MLPHALLTTSVPLLVLAAGASAAGARGGAPIAKRIRWFTPSSVHNPLNTDFLLGPRGKPVAHGIYPMGAGSITENGTLHAGTPDPAIQRYLDAGLTVMPCMGGDMLPRAAFVRKDSFADEVLDWVLKYNLSGITLDWESHGDDGGDAYVSPMVSLPVCDLRPIMTDCKLSMRWLARNSARCGGRSQSGCTPTTSKSASVSRRARRTSPTPGRHARCPMTRSGTRT